MVMEFPEFVHRFFEAAVEAGIATAKPTQENLNKARQRVDELKRQCECYAEGDKEFEKTLPNMWKLHKEPKIQYAETVRGAVREVGMCCLEYLLRKRTIIRSKIKE